MFYVIIIISFLILLFVMYSVFIISNRCSKNEEKTKIDDIMELAVISNFFKKGF